MSQVSPFAPPSHGEATTRSGGRSVRGNAGTTPVTSVGLVYLAENAGEHGWTPADNHASGVAQAGDVVRLTSGDDRYRSGDTGEHILGLRGNDDIIGGKLGGNTIEGGPGNDFIGGGRKLDFLFGGKGDDDIYGGGGKDQLFGGEGDDQIDGGFGPDVISGGLGRDQINPGSGSGPDAFTDGNRDVIVYASILESPGGNGDTLFNFRPGEDRIDLSQIDANTTTPEDDAFRFIGRRAFSGTPGELQFDGVSVLADLDGDRQPDFEIAFSFIPGDIGFHARDFIL